MWVNVPEEVHLPAAIVVFLRWADPDFEDRGEPAAAERNEGERSDPQCARADREYFGRMIFVLVHD